PSEVAGDHVGRNSPTASATNARAPSAPRTYRKGGGVTRADAMPAQPPAAKASNAKYGWGEVLPGKTPTPRIPRPSSNVVMERRDNRAATTTKTPVTTIVVSKIAADGWSTMPSGGSVPPRSLMVFRSVRYG